MMDFLNGIRSHAEATAMLHGACSWGVVTSAMRTDSGYMVKVLYQPGSVPSGWLPVLAQSVGPGWGLVSPPQPGMQAFIAPDMGNGEHGVVLGLSYSTQAMPPVPPNAFGQSEGVPVEAGEIALVSAAGAVIRLCADGTIYIRGHVNLDGNLTIRGNVNAVPNQDGTGGDLADRHGTLDRLRGAYDAHAHTGVKAGGDTSGGTTQPDQE